ncbi:cellulase family glycosylhydrolase [Paenibacillus silvae]|uniref:cellulase family glycosylhydrolase n=1 Tax=Paenibacillus silvae TaxID=1325358 RepID=UPI0020029FB5|nr:cellulase family glycosylhydrolase [Paenibacillus silvae]MCK6073639.1 cellulase family glycosylhydrolase [Paenibacillus silvae]MCK6148885.1 cellulase family glycosylhydrolase [Paenibacillus silvae]MCK6267184.1 cellulase family glycosylhydrolase [Paenibacillus silvae]
MPKNRKSILSLAVAAALVMSLLSSTMTAAAADHPDPADTPATMSKMQAYVNAMEPGWNLGNSLDAVGEDETAWGNPRITQELIQSIADEGYNSIRIPVTWEAHIGSGPDYVIDTAYINRVQEVVGWALDADLYVMINLHHDSWRWISYMENDYDNVLARYNAIWTQIADKFKDAPDKLMFESVNEPRFSEGGTTNAAAEYRMLDTLNTSFHHIVRNSGGHNDTRPLVLPTMHTSSAQPDLDALNQTIQDLDDPNLIATVHYYGFWPFSVNIAGFTTFNEEVQKDVTDTFDRVYNAFTAKGIPVIIGEYGLLGFDQHTGVIEQGEKLKFFEFVAHYSRQKQMTTMLWDNGQHFERTSFTWSDQQLFDMMRAGWSGRSSTAETDQIYLKQHEPVQDVKISLHLNGNRFFSLKNGKTPLVRGKDYTIRNGVLTLKSSLLSRLTSTDELGVNARLTAGFSQGADWELNVIQYNTPVFNDAAGTTSAFAIPVTFGGDQLATMEATYANGENAGPQNWTSFKEFAYTFSPDYERHVIELKPNFFKETKDGEIHLKFHFWSGDVIDYTITKKGEQVTGTSS